ncbi:hypothetical protein BP6252_10090 [Coleophoma cylindrospora]|uniref:Uncharacterized protein n=1 Tax=Coleophoma cylindrospora TaxID=1849047 RepID=A0A3D8QXG4_9HELO|nr:hypothetical protein BP6252_10090 [Coleophoma cylindrospora]
MGNDGGSIPTRRELVKNAARNPNTSELKATQLESQTHHWTYCPLSNRPLAEPIVSDSGGNLYNKDAVIEYLIPNDEAPQKDKEKVLQGRVKSLKDVVEVKFKVEKSGREEKRLCPITSKELGPLTKSVYLVPCGHAFAEAAIKEVQGDVCVECNEQYATTDVISILPLAKEDIERLTTRAAKLKESGLTHSLKKAPGSKKRKKNAEAATNATAKEDKVSTITSGPEKARSKEALDGEEKKVSNTTSKSGTPTVSGGIKNSATASLTTKVLEEQQESNKRRKLGMNDNLKSLFSSSGYDSASRTGGDFMTRGFSLPKKA